MLFKVNPPIRKKFDNEALFNGIRNGSIDVIESDHAPHTLEEKNVDFNNAPAGIPGVETMYPIFLYLAKQKQISFKRLIDLVCEKPSNILNVSKGKFEIGRDADFIVLDIKKISKIKSENLHSKCQWSPYEGFSAIFPTHLFIRGEKIIEDKEILGEKGFGKFVGDYHV